MLKYLSLRAALASLLVALVTPAAAAVGMRTLAANEQTGSVTLWYPTTAVETPRELGPYRIEAAWDAPAERGNGRLIMLSHGSGGSAIPQHDLARALVHAGFIVASPEHQGDNWHDDSAMGPRTWMRRPHEISAAIDRVASDPRLGALFDVQRVGVYGMSAGGLTALTLAGARWIPSRLESHCRAHRAADEGLCSYGMLTTWYNRTLQRLAMWYSSLREDSDVSQGHVDARIKAAVAAVPVAAVIDPPSLAAIAMPVGLVVASEDRIVRPALHVQALQAACARCRTLAMLDGAGHDSVLSPWPTVIAQQARLSGPEAQSFDRARLKDLYRTIAQFFAEHL